MEDHFGPARDQRFRETRDGEIAGHDIDRTAGLLGLRRRHDVLQGQPADLAVAEPAVAQEPLNQFAADHAGGAQNQNVQSSTPFIFSNFARLSLPSQRPLPAHHVPGRKHRPWASATIEASPNCPGVLKDSPGNPARAGTITPGAAGLV